MPSEDSRRLGRKGSVKRSEAGGDKNRFLNSSVGLFFDSTLFPNESTLS